MMAYQIALGRCNFCGALFTFNPTRVPSAVVRWVGSRMVGVPAGSPRPADAVNEPLCRECVERANKARKRIGAPLIEVLPGVYEPQGKPIKIVLRWNGKAWQMAGLTAHKTIDQYRRGHTKAYGVPLSPWDCYALLRQDRKEKRR